MAGADTVIGGVNYAQYTLNGATLQVETTLQRLIGGVVVPLASLNGTNGFRLDGVAAGDESGRSVSAAGDVNGDGYDDLVVGAYRANPNGTYAGASYVVFGHGTAFNPTLALAGLDGTNGFRLDGAAAGDNSGYSVSAAGDVNGDGYDDLVVGAVGDRKSVV